MLYIYIYIDVYCYNDFEFSEQLTCNKKYCIQILDTVSGSQYWVIMCVIYSGIYVKKISRDNFFKIKNSINYYFIFIPN